MGFNKFLILAQSFSLFDYTTFDYIIVLQKLSLLFKKIKSATRFNSKQDLFFYEI